MSRSLLDEATAAFLQGGVSIVASSCDGHGHLSIARAVGCHVSSDRRRVTLFLSSPHPILEAIGRSGRIAVAFTKPSTHHAIQLKGEDAALTRRNKDALSLSARYVDAFVSELCPLGYTEALIRTLTCSDPETLSAVAFHPSEVYLQTPGPRAGTRL